MPLKLSLKPGERFVVNGAVLQNGDRRAVLLLQNKASILREKDIIQPEDANTPARRIYFPIMMMYLDPTEANRYYDEFVVRLNEFMGAIRSTEILKECVSLSREVMAAGLLQGAHQVPETSHLRTGIAGQCPFRPTRRRRRRLRRPRQTEYRAFAVATRGLIDAAALPAAEVGRRAEALAKNRRLWMRCWPPTAPPRATRCRKALRAQIISLSIFVDRIRSAVMREGASFDVLIEINRTIMQGLSPSPVPVAATQRS